MHIAALLGYLTVINPVYYYWKNIRGMENRKNYPICWVVNFSGDTSPITRVLTLNTVLFLLFNLILVRELFPNRYIILLSGFFVAASLIATGLTASKPRSKSHSIWSRAMVISIFGYMLLLNLFVTGVNIWAGMLLFAFSSLNLIGSVTLYLQSKKRINYHTQIFFIATLSLWMVVLSTYLLLL